MHRMWKKVDQGKDRLVKLFKLTPKEQKLVICWYASSL